MIKIKPIVKIIVSKMQEFDRYSVENLESVYSSLRHTSVCPPEAVNQAYEYYGAQGKNRDIVDWYHAFLSTLDFSSPIILGIFAPYLGLDLDSFRRMVEAFDDE